MAKNTLKIKVCRFDSTAIASALKISENASETKFRDGRVASRFSEHWAARLYDYLKHGNTNQHGSDGEFDAGELGGVEVSVKSLTNSGVKFQKSKFVGSGRSCTHEDLIDSINDCERYVVVDITKFPEVRFVIVLSRILAKAAQAKHLTPGGWSESKFYGWLGTAFEVSSETVEL
ncbi:MAG: hypothetical protein ACRETW_16000 [Stenotrophobium sp.]